MGQLGSEAAEAAPGPGKVAREYKAYVFQRIELKGRGLSRLPFMGPLGFLPIIARADKGRLGRDPRSIVELTCHERGIRMANSIVKEFTIPWPSIRKPARWAIEGAHLFTVCAICTSSIVVSSAFFILVRASQVLPAGSV